MSIQETRSPCVLKRTLVKWKMKVCKVNAITRVGYSVMQAWMKYI